MRREFFAVRDLLTKSTPVRSVYNYRIFDVKQEIATSRWNSTAVFSKKSFTGSYCGGMFAGTLFLTGLIVRR